MLANQAVDELEWQHKPLHEIVRGIPADAKLINVQHGWPNEIDILLESREFEAVDEGEPIPFLTVTTRQFSSEVVRFGSQ